MIGGIAHCKLESDDVPLGVNVDTPSALYTKVIPSYPSLDLLVRERMLVVSHSTLRRPFAWQVERYHVFIRVEGVEAVCLELGIQERSLCLKQGHGYE